MCTFIIDGFSEVMSESLLGVDECWKVVGG